MSTSTLQEDERVVAALCAPFPEEEIRWVPKGHGDMAYITARHAMNRLDEVVGPGNWSDDYVEIGDGLKCLLSVRFTPDGPWITKCGFGAGAGMKDADDDEKSAESSAFKRAAVKFGIGRYLYNNGVPSFCGDCPLPNKSKGVKVPAPRQAEPPRNAPQQRQAATGNGAPRQYDNYKIPPPGKAVFAWAKRIGDDYGFDLIPGMRKAGQAMGAGTDFVAWKEDEVNEICLRAIKHIKTLENYDGKFDHINTDGDQQDDGDGPTF